MKRIEISDADYEAHIDEYRAANCRGGSAAESPPPRVHEVDSCVAVMVF